MIIRCVILCGAGCITLLHRDKGQDSIGVTCCMPRGWCSAIYKGFLANTLILAQDCTTNTKKGMKTKTFYLPVSIWKYWKLFGCYLQSISNTRLKSCKCFLLKSNIFTVNLTCCWFSVWKQWTLLMLAKYIKLLSTTIFGQCFNSICFSWVHSIQNSFVSEPL